MSLGEDLRTEAAEGAVEARLDRAAPAAEGRGDLRLRQFQDVAQGQNGAILLTQAVEVCQQPGALFGGDHGRVGWVGRPRGLIGAKCQDEAAAAGGGEPAVPGLVGDDPQEPGAERRAGAEARQRQVGVDEGRLGDVLGLVGVTDDDVGDAEGKPLVAPYEVLVGGRLPTLGAGDQLGLVQRASSGLRTKD